MQLQILTLALAALATAAPSPIAASNGTSTSTSGVDFKPCKHSDPATDPAQVLGIDFAPNPPLVDTDLNITVRGVLRERLEDGAKLKLAVKMGFLTILRRTVDLCELVPGGCPVEPGEWELAYTQPMEPGTPANMPFTVQVNVEDKDAKKMACVNIPNVVVGDQVLKEQE